MYPKESFIHDCQILFTQTEGNLVDVPDIGSVVLYDTPLIGFADSSDELFERYRNPEIIGPHYFAPKEWLPSAQSVISFFLPFTEKVRISNRSNKTDPSPEWLYGRIEGQSFITQFMTGLQQMLQAHKIESCVPSQDERFSLQFETTSSEGVSDFHVDSRWSERHAAYACGLGTFGLSRGLISERGIAGRYASIIVSESWQPTSRNYSGIDDYCIRCGACIRNCPAQAISLEYGKNNVLCNAHVEKMKAKYSPRYGCGKCQVGVPCETKVPGMLRSSAL